MASKKTKKQIVDYWKERESKAINTNIADREKLAKISAQRFARLHDELNETIDRWIAKYADDNGLTLAQARQRIDKADIAYLEDLASKYVGEVQEIFAKGGRPSPELRAFSSEANAQMKLYNLTMKVNRLEALKSEIGIRTVRFYSEEAAFQLAQHENAVLNEYSRMAGILGGNFKKSVEQIDKIIYGSHQTGEVGYQWSEVLWGQCRNFKTTLDSELTSAIIRGKNPRDMARRMRSALESATKVGVYESERLARTEMARIQGDVQMDSITTQDYHQYIFIAEPTACDKCAELDGHIFDTSKANVGKNMYPIHPNCCCSIAPYLDPDMIIASYKNKPYTKKTRIDDDPVTPSKTRKYYEFKGKPK